MYRLPFLTEKMCVSLYGKGGKTGEPILDTNSFVAGWLNATFFSTIQHRCLPLNLCRSLAEFCGIDLFWEALKAELQQRCP